MANDNFGFFFMHKSGFSMLIELQTDKRAHTNMPTYSHTHTHTGVRVCLKVTHLCVYANVLY